MHRVSCNRSGRSATTPCCALSLLRKNTRGQNHFCTWHLRMTRVPSFHVLHPITSHCIISHTLGAQRVVNEGAREGGAVQEGASQIKRLGHHACSCLQHCFQNCIFLDSLEAQFGSANRFLIRHKQILWRVHLWMRKQPKSVAFHEESPGFSFEFSCAVSVSFYDPSVRPEACHGGWRPGRDPVSEGSDRRRLLLCGLPVR